MANRTEIRKYLWDNEFECCHEKWWKYLNDCLIALNKTDPPIDNDRMLCGRCHRRHRVNQPC